MVCVLVKLRRIYMFYIFWR